MELIKHRPKVRLRCPAVVVPGVEFPMTVEVVAREPVTIAGIEATIVGALFLTLSKTSSRIEVARLTASVAGAARLTAGHSAYPLRATLPADAPPTQHGTLARSEYFVRVRVAIDLWPDRVERFALVVGMPPDASEPAAPVLVSTRPPSGTEPYLELALDSPVVAPGQVLPGAIALGNVETARYRGVRIALMMHERVSPTYETWTRVHLWELPAPSTSDTPAPFRLQLPDGLTPTHATRHHAVQWALDVRALRDWGMSVSAHVPLKIVAAGSPVARQRLAVPLVGSPRIAALWGDVARAAGLAVDGDGIHGQIGQVDLRLFRTSAAALPGGTAVGSDGLRGMLAVAELRYPDLRCGLRLAPASLLGSLFETDVTLGDAAVDRRYRVEARDAAQVRALLAPLLPWLGEPAVQVTMDDHALRVVLPDAGYQRQPIEQLVRFATRIASLLPVGDRVPPPTALGLTVPAWQELAAACAGTFHRGDGTVEGERGGERVRVDHEWSPLAEHRGVWLQAAIEPPLEADPDGGALDAEARALATRLRAGAQEGGPGALRLSRERVVLRSPPPADPRSLLEPLDTLVALARALRPRAGPYR